jgi:ABC-type uncharacterized transport system substrate-binding protein
MRRREFISLLGGAAAAWPLAARGQQVSKVWRIGYLAESRRRVDEIFSQSLRNLGYIEGSNLTMSYRWAAGGSFEPLADDLVAQNVDLIVAVASPATRAVKERTGGNVNRASVFAKELVALQPDVILVQGTPVTAALKRETRSIPIVFATVLAKRRAATYDCVETC